MRLFLDANVLFSAARSADSRAHALFQLARAGLCVLVSSPFPIEEARRNTGLKQPERAAALEALLRDVEVGPECSQEQVAWAQGQGLPGKDAPILAAAVLSRCDVLVTGDRSHFGALFDKAVGGVTVLSLRAALERLLPEI
jgi:uncharacterized protein